MRYYNMTDRLLGTFYFYQKHATENNETKDNGKTNVTIAHFK